MRRSADNFSDLSQRPRRLEHFISKLASAAAAAVLRCACVCVWFIQVAFSGFSEKSYGEKERNLGKSCLLMKNEVLAGRLHVINDFAE